jgi:multiple sugar transport system substrate-binding protein
MPRHHTGRSGVPSTLTRRSFLRGTIGATGLLLLTACGGATQAPAPKPTEAPKPAAKPTDAPVAKPAEAAKPAATTAPAAKAPLSFKGTSLSVLQWASFIPEADPFFKKQIEDDFMKDTGAQVTIEFVNADDLQPKINAAVQSGSGPDVIQFQYNWQHIYKDAIVDLTDIAEDVKKNTGDFFPQIEAAIKVDGKYLAVPHDLVPNAMHWRKSWFKEAGAEKFPATYGELFEVGKKLKANGHPIGQALSHAFGDPPTWAYPLLWGYGGREVDEQGKVAINSPDTIAAVAAMQQGWKDGFDEAGLSYDGSANNRAFLAETISATLNGASIWWVARRDKVPLFEDIGLDLLPAGPKGRALFAVNNNWAIMKYSKGQDAAREFIRWSMQDSVWMPWFEINGSYVNGVGPKQDNNPIWDKFPPIVQVFKNAGTLTRAPGWPGSWNQQAGLAQSKYIVVDMFARAVQGESPEQAVAWAENELKQVYT